MKTVTPQTAQSAAILPGSTLYLRLPTDSAIPMVSPVLKRHGGDTAVVLYIEMTKTTLRAPRELCITATQALIDELSDMLGAKNVVLK